MTHVRSEDQDRLKGALEQEEKDQQGNTSMQGPTGHPDQDPMLAADTDFPEPGENPEQPVNRRGRGTARPRKLASRGHPEPNGTQKFDSTC
jgi:hypothetical protein